MNTDTNLIKITKRTRNLGWDYNCSPDRNGHFDYPTKPYHTGTARKVGQAIENDHTYARIKSGTNYSSAWFVKVGKSWKRIITDRLVWFWDMQIDGEAMVEVQ